MSRLAELREANPQLLEAGWVCERVDDQQGALVLKRKLAGNKEWLFAVNLGNSALRVVMDPNSRLVNLPCNPAPVTRDGELVLEPDQAALIEFNWPVLA